MKNIILTFILLSSTFINAQITTDLGLKGGVNFARFTQNDNNQEKFKTLKDFYIGGFAAFNFTKHYTLQPELQFSKQGTIREYLEYNTTIGKNELKSENIKINYLSLCIINKFKFNRFNLQVGPTFDVIINNKEKTLNQGNDSFTYNNNDDITNIDFAFILGTGINITKNFGIEARIKKGIIPIDNNWNSTNIVYQAGIYYLFNIK